MSLFEIVSQVESQSVQLERARAVLIEATNHFEGRIEANSTAAYCLAANSGHILLLLHVVDEILYAVLPRLDSTVDEMMKIHRDEETI